MTVARLRSCSAPAVISLAEAEKLLVSTANGRSQTSRRRSEVK